MLKMLRQRSSYSDFSKIVTQSVTSTAEIHSLLGM